MGTVPKFVNVSLTPVELTDILFIIDSRTHPVTKGAHMIYLDNGATSFPKPECVKTALLDSMDQVPVSQFRSYTDSKHDAFSLCRKQLGLLLGIEHTDRIFFTSGATDSLNQVIYGLSQCCKHIITTATEHNSVLRPLY